MFYKILETKKMPIYIFFLAFFVRLCYYLMKCSWDTIGASKFMYNDCKTYLTCAQYILDNGLIDYFKNEISASISCGNPLYLAFLSYIYDGNLFLMRLTNVFISALLVVLVYLIAKKVFDYKVAFFSALLLCFDKIIVSFSVEVLTEPLFLFFFFSGLFILIYKNESKNYGYMVLVGLFWACAAHVRPIVVLLPGVIFLYEVVKNILMHRPIDDRNVKQIGIVLISLLIFVSPCIVKNSLLFDMKGIATGGGNALILGSCLETNGDEPPFYGKSYRVAYPIDTPDDLESLSVAGDKYLWQKGIKRVKENLGEYMVMNTKKIYRLIAGNNYTWFYDNTKSNNVIEWYKFRGLFWTGVNVLTLMMYAFIAVFGACGVWRYRKDGQKTLCAVIAGYFLIFSIPFLAILRYGIVIHILLMGFASAEFLSVYGERNYKKLGIESLCVLLLAAYTCSGL